MKDDRKRHQYPYLKIEMETNSNGESIDETVESKFTGPINAPGRMAYIFPAVT